MKIYAIKGSEGQPGYLKQSMKLPKSWATKPLLEVLQLFCTTYNKKFPDAQISPEGYHFERPLGSTLFPDDHVGAALAEYCDVFVVEGAVKYKGPPPGTAAAAEAAEAEERKRAARNDPNRPPSSMGGTQGASTTATPATAAAGAEAHAATTGGPAERSPGHAGHGGCGLHGSAGVGVLA